MLIQSYLIILLVPFRLLFSGGLGIPMDVIHGFISDNAQNALCQDIY